MKFDKVNNIVEQERTYDESHKSFAFNESLNTVDGNHSEYVKGKKITVYNELATNIFNSLVSHDFDVLVTGNAFNREDNVSADIYVSPKTNDGLELHVRIVDRDYIQFREISNSNEGNRRAGEAISAVLQAVPDGTQVEVHVNLNNPFWAHIASKYPQYKWTGVTLKEDIDDPEDEDLDVIWFPDGTKYNEVKEYLVDLPEYLYHATPVSNYEKIKETGLIKGKDISHIWGAAANDTVYLAVNKDTALEYCYRSDINEDIVVLQIPVAKLNLDKLYIDANEEYYRDDTGRWDVYSFEYDGVINLNDTALAESLGAEKDKIFMLIKEINRNAKEENYKHKSVAQMWYILNYMRNNKEKYMKESIEPLDGAVYTTDDGRDIVNLFINKPKFYRVMYDSLIDRYFISSRDHDVHYDLFMDGVENGYYTKIDDLMNAVNGYEWYWDLMSDGGRDLELVLEDSELTDEEKENIRNKYADFGGWLEGACKCFVFVPEDDNKQEYDYATGDDGYTNAYEIDTGTIYTRYFPIDDIPELYKDIKLKSDKCKETIVDREDMDESFKHILPEPEDTDFDNKDILMTTNLNDIVARINNLGQGANDEDKFVIDDDNERYFSIDPWFGTHFDAFDTAFDNGYYPELCKSNEHIEGKIPYDEYVDEHLDNGLYFIKAVAGDGEPSGELNSSEYKYEYVYPKFNILTRFDFKKCSLYNKLGQPLKELTRMNETMKFKHAVDLEDIVEHFGLLENATDSDATYILPDGRILDTREGETSQHENIAKYIENKYNIDDIDDNNGSIFMNKINAIRFTPWVSAMYLPKKPITSEQKIALIDALIKLDISNDNPLMMSTLDGEQFTQVEEKDIDLIDDYIERYYTYGIL